MSQSLFQATQKSRYNKVYEVFNDFLSDYLENNAEIIYPLSVENLQKIIGYIGAEIYSYSQEDSCHMINSEDGYTIYEQKSSRLCIYYNKDMPPERIKFTLAHEIGHILLGHLFNTNTNIQQHKGDFEKEANCFARNLLLPAEIALPMFDNFDIDEIVKITGLSYTFIDIRSNYVRYDYKKGNFSEKAKNILSETLDCIMFIAKYIYGYGTFQKGDPMKYFSSAISYTMT